MADQTPLQDHPRLRSLTQRAGGSGDPTRSPAKAISQVRPGVVVAATVGAAALVDLHSDLRLSLATLARDADVELAEQQRVLTLATGFIELGPSTGDDGPLPTLRVDPRGRLRLTRGVAHRLGVAQGSPVLVTCDPETSTLRLLNLATLSDALEAYVAADTPPPAA